MAKAGLSFANPMLEKTNIGPAPNPYAPFSPTTGMGMDNLAPSSTDMVALGQQLVKGTQFTMPELAPPPPDIGVNAGTGEVFVQGKTFAGDDAATALEAEALLSQPGKGELPAGYTALTPEAYQQWTASIRNPTMTRLAKKGFGRGVDIQQQLAGQFLQFAGAEKLGGDIVAAQEEELRKSSPYSRAFTEIGQPNRGVLDWFVGNLAEQGPNLILSALTGFGGSAAGAATVNASTRTLAKQFLKTPNVQSTMAAAEKYAANPASLTPAEVKLLHEAAAVTSAARIAAAGSARAQTTVAQGVFDTVAEGARVAGTGAALQQARLRGAGLALGAQNYATGVADVYGNTMEAGDPDRATAVRLGIPYAVLESLPEFVLASRIFGTAGAGRATIRSMQGTGAKAGAIASRGLTGLAVGGTLEGTTEAGQEAINLFAGDVDWNSDEGVNRLVNSFAAGFGVGGPIGGIANIPGKAPVNLLDQSQTTEPPSSRVAIEADFGAPPPVAPSPGATIPPGTPSGTQPDMFGGVGEFTPAPGFAPAPSPVTAESGLLTPGEAMRRGDEAAAAPPARQELLTQKQRLEQFVVSASEQAQAMARGDQPFDSARLQRINQQVASARTAIAQIDQMLGQMAPGALQAGPPQMDFGYPVNPTSSTPLSQVIDQTLPPPMPAAPATPAAETTLGTTLQALQNATVPARPVPLGQVIEESLAPRGLPPAAPAEPANLTNLATSLAFQNLRRGQQGQLFPPGEVMPNARGTPVVPGRMPLKRGTKAAAQPEPAPVTQAELEAAGQTSMLTPVTGQPSAEGMRAAGTMAPLPPRQRIRKPAAPAEFQSTVTFDNGTTFNGTVNERDEPVRGTFTFPNGDTYEGELGPNYEFKDGTLRYADGGEFTGTFDKDDAPANGTFVDAEGNRFEGEFKKSNLYNGTYTSANGEVQTVKKGKYKSATPPAPAETPPTEEAPKQLRKKKPPAEGPAAPKEKAAPEAAKPSKEVKEQQVSKAPPKEAAPKKTPATYSERELTEPTDIDRTVPITVTLPDKAKMNVPDGRLLLNKLKSDITQLKAFLNCLKG